MTEWLHPDTALELLEVQMDALVAKKLIISRCKEGLIETRADLAIVRSWDDENDRWREDRYENQAIPLGLWNGRRFFEPSFWQTGDVDLGVSDHRSRRIFGVTFRRSGVERVIACQPAETPSLLLAKAQSQGPGSGRRKGVGGFKEQDAPLVDEMRRMIVEGEASGPFAAAQRVGQRAAGTAVEESKIRRLERRYIDKFSPA